SAPDGAVLVALRENARDDGAIIEAVDRLSGKLRERIGESLKTIRASEPLEHVTTGSLEALRKYSQAQKANDAGQFGRAVSALELDPENYVALNNPALALSGMRRFAEAESLTLRGIAVVPNATLYVNATSAQVGQGKLAEAARTVESFAAKAPNNPIAFFLR